MDGKIAKQYSKTQIRSSIPLYTRIESLIRDMILRGQMEPGERLPKEEILASRLGVSRVTLRSALSKLESESLIIRKRAKGTFISDQITFTKQNIVTGSVYDIVMDSVNYDVKPLEIKKIKISEARYAKDLREFFNLLNQDEIYRIRRLRLIKNIPIYFLENFMPLRLGKIFTMDLLSKFPVLKIIKENIGNVIDRGELYIEAVQADLELTEILKTQLYDPLIFIQIYYWHSQYEPLETVHMYTRPEFFKYKVPIDPKGFENI